MKIVNEKGKLFGVINVVDLCIIILVLLVGAVVVLKTVGTNVGPITTEESQQKVIVTYRCTIRHADQINAVKKGDQLISLLKPADAYIESVSEAVLQVPISTADGKAVYAPDPIRKELTVKFSMKAAKGNGIIKLDNQDVAVGKIFTLKTRTFETQGTIEAIEFK